MRIPLLASLALRCSLSCLTALLVYSTRANASPDDTALSELSIEQLINVKVTSVSKKEQKLSEAAAAISVITQEDIRRSGATTIPELMRLVPGMDVGRINASTWKVSSRGFGAIFSNKLLVLIDGRSVYTPLFSGVFWDEQDVMLEDVERIEVIRGPGATLWGSNAVNGVINIITKDAKDTQGGLATAGGGTEERFFTSDRYGGKIGDETSYRVYGKYFNRDNFASTFTSGGAQDAWEGTRSGFRVDSNASAKDKVTFQSDAYYGEQGALIMVPSLQPGVLDRVEGDRFSSGANVIGRWTHEISDTSDTQLQLYYDRVNRDDLILDHHRDTFDIDFQHHFEPMNGHDVVYGFEYRYYRDDLGGTFTVSFEPEERNFDLFTWFLQDEITVIDERLRVIVGSKFEHNDFTGSEYQPNVRVLWTPDETNTIWSAVSRAARLPSRAGDDLALNLATVPGPMGLPAVVQLQGSDDERSEHLWAYEAGYRAQLTREFSVDVATFVNSYTGTETFEPGMPSVSMDPVPHAVVPLVYNNLLDATTYGVETSLDWRALDYWRLVGTYSFIDIDMDQKPGSVDTIQPRQEDQTPHNQFMIRSLLELPYDLEFDSALRYVDNVPDFSIDSYFELDLRLGWRPRKDLEFALVGQNLLHEEHDEAIANFVTFEPVSIERGVYGKVFWKF